MRGCAEITARAVRVAAGRRIMRQLHRCVDFRSFVLEIIFDALLELAHSAVFVDGDAQQQQEQQEHASAHQDVPDVTRARRCVQQRRGLAATFGLDELLFLLRFIRSVSERCVVVWRVRETYQNLKCARELNASSTDEQ